MLITKVAEIHSQYGETVRIAPNKLSYTTAQAWKDIFAHIPGKEELPKDPATLQKTPNGIPNILGANKENHSRYRRLLSHAFSEKGLREQEGLIRQYVGLLVDRLGEVQEGAVCEAQCRATFQVAYEVFECIFVDGDVIFSVTPSP